ncbi:MAG: YigZ family protein [Sulfurimonas sp.]|uniref:YigZ family protein n=1 Tax=Sulfurimonas sp. TaxID=2022749 RepID=UPI0025E11BFF|nr:YigZ family protein [Sulfurimonas sp.]MCK9454825.1 YigZ family protein [Sulfurimonas sp.]
MRFVNEHSTATLEVKQSKFIAYLLPYRDFSSTLEKLKNEHQKARHFVTAYRYFNEHNQIVEHFSDDGEPRGTSGKPSLMVLQGADIINSAVIIVRYFGGTKLGTGGLVRAYSDAVNLVLNSFAVKLIEYQEEMRVDISFEYSNIRKIEYECLAHKIDILEKIFNTKSIYKLKAGKENMQKFLKSSYRLVEVLK